MLRALASHWLTLASLVLIGAGVLLAYWGQYPPTWTLAVPLLLFAINLVAAIAVRPSFRRQPLLLAFHLALLAVVLLVAASRLTYLSGFVDVAVGDTFAGELAVETRGPFHSGRLAELRFINDGFSIDYAPGRARRETRNTVRWWEEGAAPARAVIGDDAPLVIAGYRFYTSSHKGFSGAFEWWPPAAPQPYLALVNFPTYPAQELEQSRELDLPGATEKIWVQLQLPAGLLDKSGPARFQVPENYRLIIRQGEQRLEIPAAGSVDFPEGRLRHLGLRAWMGYEVFYDWTIPWLLASVVAAVVTLAAYVWQRFSQTSWQAPREAAAGIRPPTP